MATAGRLLTSESVLRLLFGALQPVLQFDAVASVECRNGKDRLTVFTARPLQMPLAESLADEVLEGLRRFSGDSHQDCLHRPVEIVPLNRDMPGEGRLWAGPPGSAIDAPLIVGGRAVGLIRVVAGVSNAFRGDKSAIIYATAQQASAFLEQLEEADAGDRSLAESLVNGLQDGIIVVDQDLMTVLSNSTAASLVARLTGNADLDKTLRETPLESLVQLAIEQPGVPQNQDYSFSEENPRYLSATATMSPSTDGNVIVVLRDVTEEHLMQERLLQSEKMASVGQLRLGRRS